jgi:hypothetical protein
MNEFAQKRARAKRVAAGHVAPPPYRPPWYPNQDPHHNPWAVEWSVTGKTHYENWLDSLAPGELLRLIEEHRALTAAVEPSA